MGLASCPLPCGRATSLYTGNSSGPTGPVVCMTNFTGSMSWGSNYSRGISGHWTGQSCESSYFTKSSEKQGVSQLLPTLLWGSLYSCGSVELVFLLQDLLSFISLTRHVMHHDGLSSTLAFLFILYLLAITLKGKTVPTRSAGRIYATCLMEKISVMVYSIIHRMFSCWRISETESLPTLRNARWFNAE